MGLTGNARITAATAAAAVLGGLATTVHAIAFSNPAQSIGGATLTMIGVIAIALAVIRRWVTDVRDERRILAAAQREAQQERSSYFAAKAALENEQGRLNRDTAAERAALAARMEVERNALHAEFEERRAALISETMTATVLMIHNGKLAPQQQAGGTLIPFPQPERVRPREHGVVGP